MKTIGLEHATLELCIKDARRERVVVTRKGKPVALVVGVEGMDEEQLQLGSSDKFWTLIEKRRRQSTIGRAQLEKKLARTNGLEKTSRKEEIEGVTFCSQQSRDISINPSPDYAMIARAFDGYGENNEEPSEVRAALQRGLKAVAAGQVALIDMRLAKAAESNERPDRAN